MWKSERKEHFKKGSEAVSWIEEEDKVIGIPSSVSGTGGVVYADLEGAYGSLGALMLVGVFSCH